MEKGFTVLLKMCACGISLLAFAACSDKEPDGAGTAPPETDFTITVSDLSPRGGKVSVTPKDKTKVYYFDVISEKALKENYGGDFEACFKSGLQQYIDRYADKLTPEQVLTAISSTGEDTYTYQWLADGSKYYVLAAGITTTAIGLTTKVEYSLFETAALIQNKFSFSAITPTDLTIKATISSADADLRYVPLLVKKADFEASKLSIEAYLDKICQEMIAYATGLGVTLPDAVAAISESGEIEYSEDKLAPAVDFLLLAAGINEEGYVITEGASCEIRTADPRKSDMTFKFEVTELSPTGAVIKYIPSIKTDRYFYDIAEKKDIEGLTDEQIIAQRIEAAGSYLGLYTNYGDYDNDMKNYLDPGKEYIALAFGYISYTTTGLFLSEPFTTPSEQYAQDFGAGTASFFGNRFGNGNDNWQLTLTASDASYWLALNCVADGAKGFATGIPAGEYTVSASGSKDALSILPDGSNITKKSDKSISAVKSGKIVVSYENSVCTIAVDVIDAAGHQVKGKFTGEVTATDYSAYPAIGKLQMAKGTFYGGGNWFINLYDYDISTNDKGYYLAFDLYVSPEEYGTIDKGLPIGSFDVVTEGLGVRDNGYTKLLFDSQKICDIKSGTLTIAKADDGYTITFKGSSPMTEIDVSYTGSFGMTNMSSSASAMAVAQSKGGNAFTAEVATPQNKVNVGNKTAGLSPMAAKLAATATSEAPQQPRTRIADKGTCLRHFDL